MNIFELIKLSLKSLYGFKMRSFLTTLGIIVGIGSVVMISSLGAGFQDGLLSDVTKTYSKLISVSINQQKFKKIQKNRNYFFNESDMKIMEKIQNIDKVFVDNSMNGFDEKENYYVINPLSEKAFHALDTKISIGRPFRKEEFKIKNNLGIIGRTSAITMFGSEKNALGKQVSFQTFEDGTNVKLTIIATFIEPQEKAKKTFGENYISIITTDKEFETNNFNMFITIKVLNEKEIQNTVNSIKRYLKIKSNNNDIYEVKQISEEINQITDILDKISIFISLIASISLVVGGIGVMNIMLVSVTERITEIGLRKAIGAKNKDILLQFLIESVILTLVGGIIGVIFGMSLAFLVGIPFEIIPVLKLKVLLLSLIVSMGTGLIFGIYPAKKATKLSPMEALRSE